jgi:hypothetical protein
VVGKRNGISYPIADESKTGASGGPKEYYDEIRQGWHDYYWSPMKEMLAPTRKIKRPGL